MSQGDTNTWFFSSLRYTRGTSTLCGLGTGRDVLGEEGCEKVDLRSTLCCVTKKEESESGWPGNDGDPSENGTK